MKKLALINQEFYQYYWSLAKQISNYNSMFINFSQFATNYNSFTKDYSLISSSV